MKFKARGTRAQKADCHDTGFGPMMESTQLLSVQIELHRVCLTFKLYLGAIKSTPEVRPIWRPGGRHIDKARYQRLNLESNALSSVVVVADDGYQADSDVFWF